MRDWRLLVGIGCGAPALVAGLAWGLWTLGVLPDGEKEASTARANVEITANCKRAGFGAFAVWEVWLYNRSTHRSFRDLRYRTTYAAHSGKILRENEGELNVALGPRESTYIGQVNDGAFPQQATACLMELIN